MDRFGRPADIGECYEHYIGIVKREIIRAGIDRDDVDDVAHELMIKFWQKDFISKYDSAKRFGPNGTKRSMFTTLLRSFVRSYVRQDKDKQYNRARREPVRLESPAYTSETGPVMWIEVVGGTEDLDDGRVELRDLVQRAYTGLKEDLAAVFEVMVAQVEETGVLDRKEIAALFSVSPSKASDLINEVRRELAVAGVPVP